jgi:uncharacterized protein YqjF (DUF2071 family)
MEHAMRQWPAPENSWFLWMAWQDLCFLHWPVDPDLLRSHLPRQVSLDTREGTAWLGMSPFLTAELRPRLVPSIPLLSRFEELNVRTYVTVEDKPGIWFFSLEASSLVPVMSARAFLGLPYHYAEIKMESGREPVSFHCRRWDRTRPGVELKVEYRPTGPVHEPEEGSLEHWLTERYCLYTIQGGTLYRLEIDHAPWPLQEAEAHIERNTIGKDLGLELRGAPLCHFARELDVKAWLPERAGQLTAAPI